MKKKVLTFSLITLMLSFATGCSNTSKAESTENTTMVETNSGSSISNNINRVFDGVNNKTENGTVDYTENLPQDINTRNGYKKMPNINTPSGTSSINQTNTPNNKNNNERFGEGMEGAEEIIGNTKKDIKKETDKVYDESKKVYDNIKNRIKS